MGLRNWFRAPRPSEVKASSVNDALARLIGDARPSDSGVTVTEDVALSVSTVIACVTLIANDVATLPFSIRRRVGAGSEEAVDAPEHDLLFRRPNAWQTAFEFRQMMTAQAVLRGHSFAYKVFDGAGRVRELWPLQAREVSLSGSGPEIRYAVAAYDGSVSGFFDRERIMHLRGFTWDGVSGRDRLAMARDAIGLDAAARGTQSKAFKNGSRMPGFDGSLM